MPVEERRAKFTFLYVDGQLHLNPHAAREAGLAVEVPGAALAPTGVPGGAVGDPGSRREAGGPGKRGRRARLGRAPASRDGGPGTGTAAPPKGAEPGSPRGPGSPPRRRKAAASTLRSRKGDAASQFLVFCQRHRDEVGAVCVSVSTCFSAFPGPPALCRSRLTGHPLIGTCPPAGEQVRGSGCGSRGLPCARTWPRAQVALGHLSRAVLRRWVRVTDPVCSRPPRLLSSCFCERIKPTASRCVGRTRRQSHHWARPGDVPGASGGAGAGAGLVAGTTGRAWAGGAGATGSAGSAHSGLRLEVLSPPGPGAPDLSGRAVPSACCHVTAAAAHPACLSVPRARLP